MAIRTTIPTPMSIPVVVGITRTCRRERTAPARAGTVDVTTTGATEVARAVVTHRDLDLQLCSIADEISVYKTEWATVW